MDLINHNTQLRFFFVTPVWGREYTDLFLEVSLPSHLALGNLPSLSNLANSTYLIFTTPKDAECIRQNPVFDILQSLIKVEIHLITEMNIDKYSMMSACHKRAINFADKQDGALVFLPPDVVLADGSMKNIEGAATKGKRVVFLVGLRLILENIAPQLKSNYATHGPTISIQPRQLMHLAMRNLHPITLTHLWENGPGEMVPNNLFWRIDNEGLLGRCFHLMPLMVYPRNKQAPFFSTIDFDFVMSSCPNRADWHIVEDSDEILVCELTPRDRRIFGLRKGSLEDLIYFAELSTHSTHRDMAKHRINLHCGTRTPDKWMTAETQSNIVMESVYQALKRSSTRLLLLNPVLLFRRLRCLAYQIQLHQQATQNPSYLSTNPIEHLAAQTVGRLLNQAHSIYASLVRFAKRFVKTQTADH